MLKLFEPTHFFTWFADPILCGNWLDNGPTNGLEFSTVRDSNSFYNSTGGGIYVAGVFRELISILCIVHTLYNYKRSYFYDLVQILILNKCFQEGTSNYFKGLMLILCYLIVAASFFVHVDPDSSKYFVWHSTSTTIPKLFHQFYWFLGVMVN